MEKGSNNSLMKKTKKELIDIILRKDDVEQSLRNEVEKLHNMLENERKLTDKNYKDYSDAFKELDAENEALKKDCKKVVKNLKDTIFMWQCAAFGAIVIAAIAIICF